MINIPKISQNIFRTDFFSCEDLVERIDTGQLKILGYSFQKRNSYEVALYVQIFLLGKIVGDLAIDQSESTWYVTLGQRQLLSIYKFIKGEAIIEPGYCFVKGIEVTTFSNLPLAVRRKLLNQKFQVAILNADAHDPARFQCLYILSRLQGNNNMKTYAKMVFPNTFAMVNNMVQVFSRKYAVLSDKEVDGIEFCLLYLYVQNWKSKENNCYLNVSSAADLTNILYLQLSDLGDLQVGECDNSFSLPFLEYKEVKEFLVKKTFKNRVVLSCLINAVEKTTDYNTFKSYLQTVLKRLNDYLKSRGDVSIFDFNSAVSYVIG